MMNKFLIGLTLLATLNCAVNCQFLKNKNVKATKPVDQKCLEFLKKDNQTSVCDFYKCFEERFPCGKYTNIVRILSVSIVLTVVLRYNEKE